MEFFSFTFNDQHIKVIGNSFTGKETLFVDDTQILTTRSFGLGNSYEFNLENLGKCFLDFKFKIRKDVVAVKIFNHDRSELLYSNDLEIKTGIESIDNLNQSESINSEKQAESNNQPQNPTEQKSENKLFSLPVLGLFFKLFKSFSVVKVALVATSAAAYSILFSWQFALVLLAILVFHEYGHVVAMKRSGLKTKGIYLIPFVGGMAVSERAKSQWQEVFIAMMGPVFGLIMSIVFYILYVFTQNHFIGLVAVFSALINLFNLLPILPLDGGHTVKSIIFSLEKYWGFVLLLAISAIGFAFAFVAGWYFFNFFIIIGVMDLLFSWKHLKAQNIPAMDRYGVLFSLIWYAITIAIFVGIIVLMVNSGLPGTEIVSAILSS